MCISIGHLSALCQEIVSPLSNWESDTLGNTQIRRPLWERTAFSRSNWPYPSDIPADGSANGSSPREKFLGTSENTRWKLRWVEEVGPQPESRAIANAKWLRDNFCLSSTLVFRIPPYFKAICKSFHPINLQDGGIFFFFLVIILSKIPDLYRKSFFACVKNTLLIKILRMNMSGYLYDVQF